MKNILRSVCFSAFLGLFAAASGADINEKFSQLKVGAVVYSNVVVTTVTATDIYFSHSRGMGNVKLKNLSPELQQHFHFDPAKGSEVEKQQREANALYREALATNTPAASAPENKGAAEGDDFDVVVPRLYARSYRGAHFPDLYVQQSTSPLGISADKFRLIMFWSPDSDPCQKAIPALNDLYAKFNDRVAFVALTQKPIEEVKKMTSPQIDFPVAIDTEARTMRFIELKAIPHVMLVDKQGIVRFEGMPDYLTEKVLERLLDKYGDE